MICGFTFFEKFLFRHKIIPLTRNVEPLTRKGKQLTRKVGVKFYGFIFWLKRIILGKLGIKNVLPIRRKHYRTAALLHDVFRKPHRQKVYLKPKYKAKTSRFLSTLRFLFGGDDGSWTRVRKQILPSVYRYRQWSKFPQAAFHSQSAAIGSSKIMTAAGASRRSRSPPVYALF